MDNQFEEEIKRLEDEITSIKTAGQKSATVAQVVSQTVDASTQLHYEDISYPTGSARGEAFFEISTSRDAIIIPTLSWYDEDVTEPIYGRDREIDVTQGITSNGDYGIFLYFVGSEVGDDSDAARTKRGETVIVNVTLTVAATQEFVIRRTV